MPLSVVADAAGHDGGVVQVQYLQSSGSFVSVDVYSHDFTQVADVCPVQRAGDVQTGGLVFFLLVHGVGQGTCLCQDNGLARSETVDFAPCLGDGVGSKCLDAVVRFPLQAADACAQPVGSRRLQVHPLFVCRSLLVVVETGGGDVLSSVIQNRIFQRDAQGPLVQQGQFAEGRFDVRLCCEGQRFAPHLTLFVSGLEAIVVGCSRLQAAQAGRRF